MCRQVEKPRPATLIESRLIQGWFESRVEPVTGEAVGFSGGGDADRACERIQRHSFAMLDGRC
jgi:hypothetical protein